MRFLRVVVAPLILFSAVGPVWSQTVLPEVVIEAERITRPPTTPIGDGTLAVIDRAFAPVTVVGQDEVRRGGARTLGDLLFMTPGITGSGVVPGAASRPIIRGFDAARVRIQENGVGSQDVSELGEDHAVPIDPITAQSVEVVRGPAALRFGGQAIGGVVNVVNNRIPTALGPEGFRASSTTAVSSVDRGIEQALSYDARFGQFAVHADVFGRTTGDYAVPGWRQTNSSSFSRGFSLGGSYFFDGGLLGASVSNIASLYGIPGVGPSANRTRIDMVQTKLNVRGEYRPEAGPFDTLRLWLGGSVYRHNEESLAAPGFFGVNATFRNRELEGRVEALARPVETPLGALSTAFGVQFGGADLATAGDAGGLIAPSQTRAAATYIVSTLELTPTIRLQAGGRVDYVSVAGISSVFPPDLLGASGDPVEQAHRRAYSPISASIALLRDLPFGFVGSLAVQHIERAPRALELFARGPHEATGTFEIGDPNLRKERAQSIEIGLRRAIGPWRLDFAAYHTRFNGFIFKRVTGVRCNDEFTTCGTGTELTQIAYSQQDATFTGAEFRTQYDLAEIGGGTFGVEAQYDFVRARFADGTNVPRIPPHRLGGGLYWRGSNWLGRMSALHAFSQREIAANETPTTGYTLVNAELSYRYVPPAGNLFGAREIVTGLVGTNLLDQRIRNHVSFRKDEVLQPGRGVRAFVTARF